MCIIAISKERNLTKEEFDNCFEHNSDGFGMGWFENGKQVFKKGIMDKKEAWGFYLDKTEIEKIGFPHVCHFRIETTGGKIRSLTHPFIVTQGSPTVLNYKGNSQILFHNGIVFGWEKIKTAMEEKLGFKIHGDISDSRIAAIAVSFNGRDYLDKLNSKFVVMNEGKIHIYGDFTTEEGITFSNGTYKTWRSGIYPIGCYPSYKWNYTTHTWEENASKENKKDEVEEDSYLSSLRTDFSTLDSFDKRYLKIELDELLSEQSFLDEEIAILDEEIANLLKEKKIVLDSKDALKKKSKRNDTAIRYINYRIKKGEIEDFYKEGEFDNLIPDIEYEDIEDINNILYESGE